MGRKLLSHPENRFNRENFEIFDDFECYVEGQLWTSIQTDPTSVVSIVDGTHSVLRMITSVDNESATLATTVERLKLIANTPLYVESRFLFTDGATATKNGCLLFGVMDAIQLDRAVDGGQTIVINDTGAVIWKKSEGEAWIFETNVAGGTQVQSISTAVPQSASHQVLAIDCVPRSATVFECRPFVDGKQLIDATSGEPIMQTITLGTSTDMDLGFELKGGHADDVTCDIDYIYASQARA